MDDDPAYDIAVACVGVGEPRCETRLRQAIAATLRRHRAPAARISVVLVDDRHIANLNETHLQHAGPTDVLAFDLRDDVPTADPSGTGRAQDASWGDAVPIDGEIYVSVETAVREAADRAHGVEAELALYVVHGTLHLLGYEDRNEREADRMHEVEDEILVEVGWGSVYRDGVG